MDLPGSDLGNSLKKGGSKGRFGDEEREREREREREGEAERERQTDRQTDRQTETGRDAIKAGRIWKELRIVRMRE